MGWTDEYRTGQTVEILVLAADIPGAEEDTWVAGVVEAINARLGFVVAKTRTHGPVLAASPDKVRAATG